MSPVAGQWVVPCEAGRYFADKTSGTRLEQGGVHTFFPCGIGTGGGENMLSVIGPGSRPEEDGT